MVLFRDTRRFEMTIAAFYGLWVVKVQAFVPGYLYPTTYLLQNFATHAEAILALQRKWRLLFPDEEALVWQEPTALTLPQSPRRPPPPEGRTT
jgi:hypothetical protein